MKKSVDIPEIDTGRLHLTAFTELDVADLGNILSEPEVTKNITANGSTPTLCRKSAEHRIGWHNRSWADKGYGVWAVRSNPTTGGTPASTLLGWCGFAEPDIGEDPEILYGLAPAAWGGGLATEAAGAAIEWLFGKTRQSGVSAVIFHRLNGKSITIVKKLGLTLRGTMPVSDFYSSQALAKDVLDYELWRLAEGRCLDADALLFEAPYKAGQVATLGFVGRDKIESALHKAARNRAENTGISDSELAKKVHDAFMSGVNEPQLEWYHRKRPA